MRVHARLKLLERQTKQTQEMKLTRVLISDCRPFDWNNVTCSRRSFVAGTLLEIVDLKGTTAGIEADDLEAFVEATPIEYMYPRAF